jgi:hypothetical protein
VFNIDGMGYLVAQFRLLYSCSDPLSQ